MDNQDTVVSPSVKTWLDEIQQAQKREKDFRKEGSRITALFEAEKKVEYQFNILYSNTETLAPALYNSTPRPVVQRRFKDPDPLGGLASKATQRTLEYLLDDGMATYATFDELMKSAVLEALVPGRGVTWFKYDASFETVREQAAENAETAATGVDTESAEPPGYESVEGEQVCGEEVPWDRFLHGYAKKWKDVPWVSREHFMDKEEVEKNFGAAIAARVEFASLQENSSGDEGNSNRDKAGMANVKVAPVYEIWDKATKKVYFVSPNFQDDFLKPPVDDPLGLSGFFPCPKPLTFVQKITSLTPVPLYAMYEEQAKELNKVTVRINKLIAALKVRGMYDGSVDGIDKVLEADDNTLIPAQNVAALYGSGGGGGLDKSVWLFPIKDIIPVLQQLYLQRNQVKQTIYEITGIADIMRGSSQASETLGAQELKNQWGTLRLKRAQKEVARYARDSLRIMTEIAMSKLHPQTLQGMTGLPIPTGDQKQQIQMQAMQLQQAGQPVPPELAKVLSGPSWSDILALLKNDLQRSYRIDIETNSTIDAEATEDKKDIGELLNALAQFLNGIGPLIESGTMPFDAAKSMMMVIVRRFKFGNEVEEQINAMQQPQAKPDPNAQKAQMEMQRLQMEMAGDAKAREQEVQLAQMDMALKQQAHQLEMEALQRQREFDILAHTLKMKELAAKTEATLVTARAKVASADSRPTKTQGQT